MILLNSVTFPSRRAGQGLHLLAIRATVVRGVLASQSLTPTTLTWLLITAFDLAALALVTMREPLEFGSADGTGPYHALAMYLARFRFSGSALPLSMACDAFEDMGSLAVLL